MQNVNTHKNTVQLPQTLANQQGTTSLRMSIAISSLFIVMLLAIGALAMKQGVSLADLDTKNTSIESDALVHIPNFELPLIARSGNFVDTPTVTDSDLPKKPYLLNVWASWCASCYKEHDFLQQLTDIGVNIVGINYYDNTDSAKKYLQEHGNPYSAVVFDKKGELTQQLGVQGSPVTFVVNGDGVIYKKYTGVLTQDIWNNSVQSCLHFLQMSNADTSLFNKTNLAKNCK